MNGRNSVELEKYFQQIKRLVTGLQAHGRRIVISTAVPHLTGNLGPNDSTHQKNINFFNGLIRSDGDLSSDLFDLDYCAQLIGYTDFTEPRLYAVAKTDISPRLFPLIGYWFSFLKNSSGASSKCLILDLDNTVWGVVGDIGWESIEIGPETAIGEAFRKFRIMLKILLKTGFFLQFHPKMMPP